VALPNSGCGPFPCVLIGQSCNECHGKKCFDQHLATEFAKLGYVGIVYSVFEPDLEPFARMKLEKLLLAERQILLESLRKVYRSAKQKKCVDPGKIVAVGHNFGGLCALDMARALLPIKGAISFNGHVEAPRGKWVNNGPINAKVLIVQDYENSTIQAEKISSFCYEMCSRGADWSMITYGLSRKSLSCGRREKLEVNANTYNDVADKRSLAVCKTFLQDLFT